MRGVMVWFGLVGWGGVRARGGGAEAGWFLGDLCRVCCGGGRTMGKILGIS